jgi:hypothetical protein
MPNVLPEKYIVDPIFLRPFKLRDGTFRPTSAFENLLNYELLLVLNGKPIGYALDFSIETNRTIDSYVVDQSKRKYRCGIAAWMIFLNVQN